MDLDTRTPFTVAQAERAGLTRKRLRGPHFQRLLRGVYVDATVPVTPTLRARAVLATAGPGAHLSHASAARVLGVPIPTLPDEHVTVGDPEGRRPREGVRVHLRTRSRTVVREGLPVSAPAQLFCELATLVGLVDLVVVGDHLVRRHGLAPAELVAAAGTVPGSAGREARRAAAYVRERVDSPMETRLRLLLVLAGLPEPQVNVTVRTLDGEPVRRYDLCWPEVRVVVEYDGRHHAEREEQWEADLGRREAIDDSGWRILVVTGRGLHREPGRTVERVFRVLRGRGMAGVPARPRPDWQPHFPAYS